MNIFLPGCLGSISYDIFNCMVGTIQGFSGYSRQKSLDRPKIPCGPSMMDYPETCWKPAGNLRGRFPAGLRQVSGRFPDFEKKITLTKNSETCRKPAAEVYGRFPEVSGRFPDNASLTDHMVQV